MAGSERTSRARACGLRPIPGPHVAFVAWFATLGCTVEGEDGATSLGGTTVPTSATTVSTSVSTSVSTTMGSASTEPPDSDASDATGDETSGGSGDPTSDPMDSSGGGSGPDEQPADGVYSACEMTSECFGATACVLVMSEGFCSVACEIAGDCPPSPAGTSVPACVPANIAGVDMTVCALDCGGGKTCPGGMACQSLGTSMVCV